eukprot:4287726-Amphidinium_carterae.1
MVLATLDMTHCIDILMIAPMEQMLSSAHSMVRFNAFNPLWKRVVRDHYSREFFLLQQLCGHFGSSPFPNQGGTARSVPTTILVSAPRALVARLVSNQQAKPNKNLGGRRLFLPRSPNLGSSWSTSSLPKKTP